MATARSCPRRRREEANIPSPCRPCRSIRSSRWRRQPAGRSGSSSTSSATEASRKDILARAASRELQRAGPHRRLQVLGQRHRDIKNGMTVPPEIRLGMSSTSRPGRPGSSASSEAKARFSENVGPREGHGERQLAGAWTNEQFDPALSWKDVEWIKKIWPGKLIIKGILDRRRRQDRGQARRRRHRGVEPWRASARGAA